MSLNLPGIYHKRKNFADYEFDSPEVTIESFNSGYPEYPLVISGFGEGKLHEGLVASVDEVTVLDNAELAYIGNRFIWKSSDRSDSIPELVLVLGPDLRPYSDWDWIVRCENGNETIPVYSSELTPC